MVYFIGYVQGKKKGDSVYFSLGNEFDGIDWGNVESIERGGYRFIKEKNDRNTFQTLFIAKDDTL